MELHITPGDGTEKIARSHAISLTIKTFKGRKNVDVHLFRYGMETEEEHAIAWQDIIATTASAESSHSVADEAGAEKAQEDARKMVLEMFTETERDTIITFLKEQYGRHLVRLTSAPVTFPVPLGVAPLSAISEGKTMGFIRFDTAKQYSLPFRFRGFYDLAEHEPLVQPREEA